MPAMIGCDAHKQFSVVVTIDSKGKTSPAVRVEHHRQEYIDSLHSLPPASEIALEATVIGTGWLTRWKRLVIVRTWRTRSKLRGAWARPTRPMRSMRKVSLSCCEMGRFRRA